MITAEVEIDNNSDLEYFKSLQSKAWPTALFVYIWEIGGMSEKIIFLKVEPSLTDTIFIFADQKTEQFYGYVWIKIDVYNKCYKLIKHEILINKIENLDPKLCFNYTTNCIAKIIKNGYDLEISDEELEAHILKIIPNIEKRNKVLISTQSYFESQEGVADASAGFNTQHIKWAYNPTKYKFWPGRIDNSLYPYPL
jgi:hypothetical protein